MDLLLVNTTLRAADEFVKTELAPAVETIKRKQLAFYAALVQAMHIDDAPGARGPGTPPARRLAATGGSKKKPRPRSAAGASFYP